MAIVQISRITNRSGNYEQLPQLSGAELGWAIDERRLFIGNGTLAEGAPVIGNTEILTEHSDITVLSNYTYKDIAVGYAAQTGPTSSTPIVRSVQTKLDDFANVRDFGAVGDGVADDTESITRALYQLYCREVNTQVRRTLYFPAGTYKISETIVIPTFAKLVGEGSEASIISLDTSSDISSLSSYCARLGDSRQQTGSNIGANNAIPPKNIEISAMSFATTEDTDIFLVDRAQSVYFNNVGFTGAVSQTAIENHGSTPLPNVVAIQFASSASLTIRDIVFDQCQFQNQTYAINTSQSLKSVAFINSKFYNMLSGIITATPVTGVTAFKNTFDNIYSEGIAFGTAELCASGFNIFYNVGKQIGGSVTTSCISLGSDNCLSNGDLFARSDADALIQPRISITSSGGSTGSTSIQLGRYSIGQGNTVTVTDNSVTAVTFATIDTDQFVAFGMTYTITRDTDVRHGEMRVASGPDDSTNPVVYSDDYSENTPTGVTLSATQTSDKVYLKYVSDNRSINGTLTYTINHLN